MKKEDLIPQQRRIRMKLSKLFLDGNHQSVEALKHIYATLLTNKKICISIDIPATNESDLSDSDDNKELASDEDDEMS